MWRRFFNKAISGYLRYRVRKLEKVTADPHLYQERLLKQLLVDHGVSKIGKKVGFAGISTPGDYRSALPICNYEDIRENVLKMMSGAEDILVTGKVNWFAKSSGTTSSRSKYLPVTDEYLRSNMISSSWDTTALIYRRRPEAKIFEKKCLVMGGSLDPWPENPEVTTGDVSAIMIKRMPNVGKPFYTPPFEVALLRDWEEKIEKMAQICTYEDVVLFGGVPTWTLVLFRRILEVTGKSKISEVWPNVRTYLHGGVGFDPYRTQFEQLLGVNEFDFIEVYNASEGYFAVQDKSDKEGMLLLLDNGIYYEFLPAEEWEKPDPVAIGLQDVEVGKHYALVITNGSGLWRYTPGDTVQFTSINPYRIRVSGRTQHFINVFGEEVIVGNTDKALAMTCEEYPAVVRDYTVGPVHMGDRKKGRHQWLIEFEKAPVDLNSFEIALDKNLRKINSDYDAKRYKDLALEALKISLLPQGTFLQWLRSKGKVGGQHKVPRLNNSRLYVDELLAITKQQ